ncbi:hypothetical protein [Bacteroides finegoldii]|uniref:hypothetical protein n=1 Tax=Bacteroides finegoldii TaxID=338188 RepID=UPI0022E02440|nr:hypothetical protein [Bacteroides finegoldii]
METTYIYNILIERGYDPHSARLVSAELIHLSQPLSGFLETWIKNISEEGDLEINSYSLSRLRRERNMTYPAALLTMDWLIKEPEQALKSLEKGIK